MYSTSPLERLNKEIKRRTQVVGIFPDVASVERLVGSILLEAHAEWQVDRRHFRQESMEKLKTSEQQLPSAAAQHLEPIRQTLYIRHALQGEPPFPLFDETQTRVVPGNWHARFGKQHGRNTGYAVRPRADFTHLLAKT